VTIQQFNEPAGGQVVFHTHVHVIPRHDGAPLRPHTGQTADPDALARNAQKIKNALGF
jgi:histidine triad (HIT) family protein